MVVDGGFGSSCHNAYRKPLPMMRLKKISVLSERVTSRSEHPFNIPAIASLENIEIGSRICFFVLEQLAFIGECHHVPLGTPCRSEHRSESCAIPSLCRATPSATSEHLVELLGSSQSLGPSLLLALPFD